MPRDQKNPSSKFSEPPVPIFTLWDDWHDQRRRPELVVIDHVRRFDHARPARLLLVRIQVAVEARKVAAGNLQAQFVACEENIARGPQGHGDLIRLSRIRKFWLLLR